MPRLLPASIIGLFLGLPGLAATGPSAIPYLDTNRTGDGRPGPIASALAAPALPRCGVRQHPGCSLRNQGLGCRNAPPSAPTDLSELWEMVPEDINLQFTPDVLNRSLWLTRTGGTLLWDTEDAVGIVAHMDYFEQQQVGRRPEERMLADVNATVTWARAEWGQMRTGVGLRWLMDGSANDVGFNVHCGADLLSLESVLLSTSVDAGTSGDSTFFRLRGNVDLIPNRLEAFGGYERLSFGRGGTRGPLIGFKLSY